MGAPRICSRCLVRLVTNAAHTRIWCPVCKRQIRLVNHSEENESVGVKQQSAATHAHSAPPPIPTKHSTPPPLPAPAPESETPPQSIIAHRVRLPRGREASFILMFLGLVGLIGGGIGLASLRNKENDEAVATAKAKHLKEAELQPAPRSIIDPAKLPKVQPRPVVEKSGPTLWELREQKALRAVFQQEDISSSEPRAIQAARKIDEAVVARLKSKGIPLAPLCSDAVFVRRVYLDVIGRIPTADEAKQFLDDKTPNRRAILIDRLLAHRDFADYWTMKWCDLLRVKSEFPINLWPNAVQAYSRWIRGAVRDNMPFDQFARTLLTASGSNFRDPPVNFYRAVQKKDATNLARAVALTFMGVRPEGWTKEQWDGMEVFFSQVGYKRTGEWKEEIVFFDMTKSLKAESAVFPDGTKVTIEADQDPREVFVGWLITAKNPWFTRNIANRVWSWLLGRGIIHEPDDIRPNNAPSNPELLALLEQELIQAKYDLRQLFRTILNSHTYQASSIPPSEHPDALTLFASYPVRRLEAEVLIDAICQVTGTTEKYSSPIPEPFTYIPENQRSVSLADASITSPFMEMFGRSSRDTGLESERNNNFTAAQRLHLLNSAHITKKIEQGPGIKQILQAGGKASDLADRLYLSILSRYPTDDERAVMEEYRTGGDGRRPGLDVAWALMNTAEFLCRH